MNRILPSIFLFVLVLVFGCKKDSQKESELKCAVFKELEEGVQTEFNYDNQGRLVKLNYLNDGKLDGSTEIVYSGNQIKLVNLNNEGKEITDRIYNTESGRITSTESTDADTVFTGYTSYVISRRNIIKYYYNTEGYLNKTEEKTESSSTEPSFTPATLINTSTFTYENDNLVREETQDAINSETRVITYTYDPEQVNTVTTWRNKELEFLYKKPSKNVLLEKKLVRTYKESVSTEITKYTYSKDEAGNITSITATRDDEFGSNAEMMRFEYKCK